MWVLLMLQHCAHSGNRPTATDEKKKTLLYFGCDFSGWYNFGKIVKIVTTRYRILKRKCTKSRGRLLATRRHCCSIRPNCGLIRPGFNAHVIQKYKLQLYDLLADIVV